MDIFKLIATGILTAVCVLTIKDHRSDIAVIVGVCGGLIMLLMIIAGLADVVDALQGVAEKSGLSSSLFKSIIKIVGIGYLTEFASNVCEDSGSKSIADKIQLGGKLCILVSSLPIIMSILDIVSALMP